MEPYDELIRQAVIADFSGWDFSWLEGRAVSADLSWSYFDLARAAVSTASCPLDLDIGGGELLASLQPLPEVTVATEGWEPNLVLARQRLDPLGVEVRRHDGTDPLPASNGEFDLVLNRHGRLPVAELARVLAPGGVVLTQQVGSQNHAEINEALGAAQVDLAGARTMSETVSELEGHGFEIVAAFEEWPEFVVYDVGALVYHLRAVPWQVPDFDVVTYEPALRALDARIRADGPLVAHDHRYLVKASLIGR